MLQHLLNDLEEMLSRLIQLRSNLNHICENSWNLLCPEGTQANGSYRIEEDNVIYVSDQVSEGDTKSTSVEGEIDYVNDLIAYGKSIRGKIKLENDRFLKMAPNCYKEQVSFKSATGRNTVNVKCSTKQPTKGKHSDIADAKQKCGEQLNTVKKSLHAQTKEACNFVKENCLRSGTEMGTVHGQNKVQGNTSRNKCGVDVGCQSTEKNSSTSVSVKYLHSCSLSLSENVKTLKMPEDLRYLLKQFYHYEDSKLKEKEEKNLGFKERFNNIVKSRLENDIQISLNQGERYLKYLDVADGFRRKLEHKSGLHIVYRSSKQLCLYEVKCQQLMELQLQGQLMDVINNRLCPSLQDPNGL